MVTVWERARRALATRLCMRFTARHVVAEEVPRELVGLEEPLPAAEVEEEQQQRDEREKSLGAVSPAPASASARRASRSGSQSPAKLCAICLGAMKSGHGQALFTAECSHKFHFQCISSNVQHGNKICPICRALWKELPFQGPLAADAAHGTARVNPSHGTARVNPSGWAQAGMLSANPLDAIPVFRTPASAMYSDDEPINLQPETAVDGGRDGNENETPASLEITTDTEFPAVQESVAQESFAILIHLKAPHAPASMDTRAPLDLVTVLDVSGSMVGMKLELLKRAMAFVIQNLRPSDRLSVIAFSSAAWRLFPLRKMTPFGQEQSLQSVDSLVANGGTNIADGLWKASRVMEDRQARNPVSSIIILSDGSGGYVSGVDADGRRGFVDVGRLYADEEMDFLATVHVPAARGDTELIRARCAYRDAVTYEIVRVGGDPAVVTVARPAGAVTAAMSVQVEREWHRVHATEDMAAAQAAAEEHDYERAATTLQSRRLELESRVSLSSDRQTQALVAELAEMQRRVLNYQRGLVHSYQTPSMVDMLHRSQALLPEVVASQQLLNRSPTIAPSSRNPPPPVVRRGVFRTTKPFAGRSSS
nr:unnamed protein product [Digitaria exilis]